MDRRGTNRLRSKSQRTDSRAEAAGAALVRFEDVEFYYDPRTVILSGISLTIDRGEFVTLLGPSGCGKSTLLNMVAGLLHPKRGDCYFEGKKIEGVNTRIGYMTQADTLLPWRTVKSNVALPLKLRDYSKAEIEERVARYLDMLDLEDAASLYPAQLSGGMKRRALLARSLIYDPEMLLMDEPFGAVDARLREQLHEEVTEAIEELGQTVLFVTHDVSEAAMLSDRIVVLGSDPSRIQAMVEPRYPSDLSLRDLRYTDAFAGVERELRDLLEVDGDDGERE